MLRFALSSRGSRLLLSAIGAGGVGSGRSLSWNFAAMHRCASPTRRQAASLFPASVASSNASKLSRNGVSKSGNDAGSTFRGRLVAIFEVVVVATDSEMLSATRGSVSTVPVPPVSRKTSSMVSSGAGFGHSQRARTAARHRDVSPIREWLGFIRGDPQKAAILARRSVDSVRPCTKLVQCRHRRTTRPISRPIACRRR